MRRVSTLKLSTEANICRTYERVCAERGRISIRLEGEERFLCLRSARRGAELEDDDLDVLAANFIMQLKHAETSARV